MEEEGGWRAKEDVMRRKGEEVAVEPLRKEILALLKPPPSLRDGSRRRGAVRGRARAEPCTCWRPRLPAASREQLARAAAAFPAEVAGGGEAGGRERVERRWQVRGRGGIVPGEGVGGRCRGGRRGSNFNHPNNQVRPLYCTGLQG